MEKIGCKKTSQAEDIKYLIKNVYQADVVCRSCLHYSICKEEYEEIADNGKR